MRRWAVLMLCGVLSAVGLSSQGASADRPKARKILEPYSPRNLNNWHVNYAYPGASVAEVLLRSRAGENMITVELQDDFGTPVRGTISQGGLHPTTFCEKTPEPVEIAPEREFYVTVYSGTCEGAAAVATEGTVTVTFHRRRPAP